MPTDLIHRQWLEREAPRWEAEGLVPSGTAERLVERYGMERQSARSVSARGLALGTTTLAALAALLIGLGIVMVFAWNWDLFGRAEKTVFAFVPLALSQSLSVWGFIRYRRSTAWREAAGIFNALSVAAAIGLIGQIYQLSGGLGDFLRINLWLLLPALFLYRSVGAFLLFQLGLPILAGQSGIILDNGLDGIGRGEWLILALSGAVWPAYVLAGYGMRRQAAAGAVAVVSVAGIGMVILFTQDGSILLPILGSFFSAALLGGALVERFGEPWAMLRKPLAGVGVAGLAITALSATFVSSGQYTDPFANATVLAWVVMVLLTVAAGVRQGLFVWLERSLRPSRLIWGAGWLVMTGVWGLWEIGLAEPARFLAAGFLLAGGLASLVSGFRQSHSASYYGGLVILAGLVLRYFGGDEYSLLVRGFAFMSLGIAFLVASLFFRYRKNRYQRVRAHVRRRRASSATGRVHPESQEEV